MLQQRSRGPCTVSAGSALLPGGEAKTYLLDELQTESRQTDSVKRLKQNYVFCIIGGITPAELAAIRQLNEARNGESPQFGDRFTITVLASDLVTGDQLIKGFFDSAKAEKRYAADEDGVLKEVDVKDAVLCRESGQSIEEIGAARQGDVRRRRAK